MESGTSPLLCSMFAFQMPPIAKQRGKCGTQTGEWVCRASASPSEVDYLGGFVCVRATCVLLCLINGHVYLQGMQSAPLALQKPISMQRQSLSRNVIIGRRRRLASFPLFLINSFAITYFRIKRQLFPLMRCCLRRSTIDFSKQMAKNLTAMNFHSASVPIH